jgi:hypothetical protein
MVRHSLKVDAAEQKEEEPFDTFEDQITVLLHTTQKHIACGHSEFSIFFITHTSEEDNALI